MDIQQIKPNMIVVDTQGHHIGTVSQVKGDALELTREGFTDDLHHFAPLAAIIKIEDGKVLIDVGSATSIEAIASAMSYTRTHPSYDRANGSIFGTSGHGTGSGGSGQF